MTRVTCRGGPSLERGPRISGSGRVIRELVRGTGTALNRAYWKLSDTITVSPPAPQHPLEGFTGSMLRPEGASRERRRHQASDEAGAVVINGMQNPPDHVRISIEITLLMIGGDAEMIGNVGKLALEKVSGSAGKKGAGKLAVEAVALASRMRRLPDTLASE